MPVDGSSTYDLNNPFVIRLPAGLDEISGIVYYPKDTALFAIKDEDGFFYKIYLNNNTVIKSWRFDKKRDFEELVLHDSIFYVLISNGNIESIKFGGNDSIITYRSQFPDSTSKNEFEAMYYDDSLQMLILLCKNCDGDGSKMLTAWGYNISTQTYTPAPYTIDPSSIAQKLGDEKIKLRPSGAAINPLTNELYILASLNSLIIITDRNGKLIDVLKLDPSIYTQPEGIAFTPSGDLIITNEFVDNSPANILYIRNKKKAL